MLASYFVHSLINSFVFIVFYIVFHLIKKWQLTEEQSSSNPRGWFQLSHWMEPIPILLKQTTTSLVYFLGGTGCRNGCLPCDYWKSEYFRVMCTVRPFLPCLLVVMPISSASSIRTSFAFSISDISSGRVVERPIDFISSAMRARQGNCQSVCMQINFIPAFSESFDNEVYINPRKLTYRPYSHAVQLFSGFATNAIHFLYWKWPEFCWIFIFP